MGWSGSLTSSSAVNSSITYTPDTTTVGGYTGTSFTAPIRGIYKFILKGSGGAQNSNNLEYSKAGGTGGTTIGYLPLNVNDVVYIGAGGPCSAAWVGKASGTTLSGVSKENLYFVAGGGGEGGQCNDNWNNTGYNCKLSTGGNGGGNTGGVGTGDGSDRNGQGGTQADGGAGAGKGSYGVGGGGGWSSETNYYALGGRGGDGYFGGGGGWTFAAANNGCVAGGGGGGSGYFYASNLVAMGTTYTNSTSQGGGSASNTRGTVQVTYLASWDGSMTSNMTIGSYQMFYPVSGIAERTYTVHTFTAPLNGIFRFELYGSGGANGPANGGHNSAGGKGGYTDGYLNLKTGETVYIGCGGTYAAAFVSKTSGTALKNISASNLYFVAGAGGGGGSNWGQQWGMQSGAGGAGGGTTGGSGVSTNGTGGAGGTQTAGGSNTSTAGYGYGNGGGYSNANNTSYHGGPGGDGYYGGAGGWGAAGGGGGSGYIYQASLTTPAATYTNSTTQGSGAASNSTGYVKVTYYALSELPIAYNGTRLTKIIYNGVEITSLYYNGTKIF